MSVPISALTEGLAGRYTIERELGRGGMATVYLVRDLKHDRPVALKVLASDIAAALGAERFHREIHLTAQLQHPHILPVYDSGDTAGRLWYTMPYVAGESLRDRLQREKQLPLEDALQLARNVLAALVHAHGHGILHRDIKPENILLEAGEAIVADFGVARAVSLAGGESLTRTGVAVGTPLYMSPEQAAGDRELECRSDLYAVGCVLYEMLAGHPPFMGITAQEILTRHAVDPVPPLRSARPAVPEGVERAVTKALAKVPADRWATAQQFAEALAAVGPSATDAPTAVLPLRTAPQARRRRVPVILGALGVAGLVVAAVLLRPGREPTATSTTPAVIRLAVLPFENLGDSADAYFADGMADAVRGKLSALPSLQVIATSSSDQYQETTKSPQQIGRELGVQYLLVGKVRWQKEGGRASRVQVSPELIQAASATTRWQQPFDAPAADLFRLQGDIASRVADALDLALGAGAREDLGKPPTDNLAAYDAFLRGERLSSRVGMTDPAVLRRAVAAYEEAVALDSTFALAWAQLSRAHSTIYVNGRRSQDDANAARAAADRAISLGPGVPQAYFARALYLSAVLREHAGALEEVTRGRRLAPGDSELLSMAGLAEQQLGRWGEAVTHFRAAQSLDPRSLATARRLARVLLWLRRYPEAHGACDYALGLSSASPDVLQLKLAAFLGQGDLAGARAALRETPSELEPTRLIAYTAWYFDLAWVLDDEQQRLLLRLTPDAFDNDRGKWGIAIARTHALRGNAAAARAYADSARVALEARTPDNPKDGVMRSNLSMALAIAGRRLDAQREGELAVKLEPIATNGLTGPIIQHNLVHTYVALGDQEAALDRLEPLLALPYYLSPDWLRIDPTFAMLRGNPRFERLVAGKGD